MGQYVVSLTFLIRAAQWILEAQSLIVDVDIFIAMPDSGTRLSGSKGGVSISIQLTDIGEMSLDSSNISAPQ